MSTIIQNSAIVFPDGTTQTTAGMPLTGGQFTSSVGLPSLTVGEGSSRIRQYGHTYTVPANTASNMDLITNIDAYSDVFFYMTMISYHSGRSYQSWRGSFGGYGSGFVDAGGGGSFSLSCVNTAGGVGRLRLSRAGYTFSSYTIVHIMVYGNSTIAALNGTLYQ